MEEDTRDAGIVSSIAAIRSRVRNAWIEIAGVGVGLRGCRSAGQVAHSLSEDVFDAVEEAAIVVLVARRRLELLLGQRRGELFEQLPLFLRQLSSA